MGSRKFRFFLASTLVPLSISLSAQAGVCDVAWDGDKVVTAIAGRPAYLRVPLKDKEQRITEVTVSQIHAFSDAKERIARVAGSSPSFIICGGSDPNAFAAKGSSGEVVGVTIGMMKLVDGDRDMAAAVIGHELAHHTHGHGEAGATREALVGIAGFLLGLAVDVRSQRRSGVPTNVGQTVGQIGAALVSRKFDRDQEREADATGFQYMLAAGFSPLGAVRLSTRMNQLGLGTGGLFFDSHPGWGERAELFQTMIAASPQAQQLVAQSSTSTTSAVTQQGSSATTDNVALAAAYSSTDAQKSFTSALAAWRMKDLVTAVQELRASASAGYAPAQSMLGWLHTRGSGVPRDSVEAVRLFRLAADQGNALAQANLGNAYANGIGGLVKDDVEAVRLFKLSADQGNSQGQANLAFAHLNGRGGISKNDDEALRLFRLAAGQNNPTANAGLGLLHATGRGGLTKNELEAARFFRLSADHGSALGQVAVGFMYANGQGGLPKDETEAIKWFRLAAAQGNGAALKQLALRGIQ